MSGDFKLASELANLSLEHWEAGRLDEAARGYSAAIDIADPRGSGTPMLYSAYAHVLSALERDSEALAHFRQALALEESLSGADGPEARVARYFLGEHCLEMGLFAEALAAVTHPVVVPGQHAILKLVEALARSGPGDAMGAKAAAAVAAVEASSSEEQWVRTRERLRGI